MANDLDFFQLIFQHDNDSKHTSKSVCQWLKSQNFNIFKWFKYSFNQNPIEHFWIGLKYHLNQYLSASIRILEL